MKRLVDDEWDLDFKSIAGREKSARCGEREEGECGKRYMRTIHATGSTYFNISGGFARNIVSR